LQSIVIVIIAIFIPVYLFIARQSRDRMSGLSTTGNAPHFRFHLKIPNVKFKICPKSKFDLHFLQNRLEFRN